jgi:predicted dehydrogenase
MTVRLGIIGAGSIAPFHAEAAGAAGVIVHGVCDVDADRAASLASAHGATIVTTDVDELLAAPDLDAVVVATPNHLHHVHAVRAMEAGKDVLLEKPMGVDVAACDEIIRVMERTGRIVQVGFVSRGAPTVACAKRLIDAGRFGRVHHVRAQWYRRRGIPGLGGWFTTRARSGGGVLIDLGVHMVDLALHLTGRPAARRASGVCSSVFGRPIEAYRYDDMWAGPPRPDGTFDVEDAATGLIRLDGVTVEIGVTWAANLPEDRVRNGLVIMGDRGGCVLDVWGDEIVVSGEEGGTQVDLRPRLPGGDPWATAWRLQHERFRDAVVRREAPGASAAHGRAVQAILEALYRSSRDGCEVEITG